MSRKLVVPGVAFTGPRLIPDSILNDGSLILLDVAHPASPWRDTLGTLSDGSRVPNLAEYEASQILGVSDVSLTRPIVATQGAIAASTYTSKGSLLFPTPAGAGVHIKYPMAVIEYIKANPTHSLGLTQWMGLTGPAGSSFSGLSTFLTTDTDAASSGTNYAQSRLAFSGDAKAHAGGEGSTSSASTSEVGPRWCRGSSGNTDDNTASAAVAQAASRIVGVGDVPATPNLNGIPSGENARIIFHRFYLEDLTVSGRTYTDLAAADAALYDAAFAAGSGRYANDDYSS